MTRDSEIIDSFLDFLKELYNSDISVFERFERKVKYSFEFKILADSEMKTYRLFRVQGTWYATLEGGYSYCALINGVWGSLDYRFADERKSDD